MPINPLKEFFKRKKAEAKFARAGPGQKLSSDAQNFPSSSSEQSSARQAAADAAMKRFNKDPSKPATRQRIATDSKATNEGKRSTESPAPIKPTTDEQNTESRTGRKELPIVDGVAQRSIQIYSTDELAQRIKQPEIDDDFFRLTVEDAKLFKQRYDEEKARNEILKTSEMRRREAEAKKPTVNCARLRFKLPNNFILEASFSGNESLGLVRDWLVATCIDRAGLELKNFDILFGLRPFKGDDFDKSVKQLGLIPATTLTVVQKNG